MRRGPTIFVALMAILMGAFPVPAGGSGRTAPGGNGQLAFMAIPNFNGNIYSMNPDGTFAGRVTSTRRGEVTLAWSPDGSRLAFARYRGHGDLFTVNADGSEEIRLTSTADVEELAPSYSPDGTRIAFARDSSPMNLVGGELWIMDADGSDAAPVGIDDELWTYVDWRPDGGAIAYVAITNSSDAFETELRSVELATGEVTTLSAQGADQISPSFSPDGTQLAYVADSGDDDEVRVVNADGTDDALLYDAGTRLITAIAWAPDGTSIAVAELGHVGLVSTIDAVTGARTVVVEQEARDLAWQPCLADCSISTPREVDIGISGGVHKRRTNVFLSLRPVIVDAILDVRLQRRTTDGFRTIKRQRVELGRAGDEIVTFDNPNRAGRCRLRVVYGGDPEHLAQDVKSNVFDCRPD